MTIASTLRKAGPLVGAALALSLMFAFAKPAMAAETLHTGSFVGQSDHVTSGTATIVKDGGRTLLVLGADFSLDGAPSPTLGFSKDGAFVKATEFAKLKSNTGRQVYELPKSLVASAYDAVTVWCAKFSVPLGSAKLSR